MQIRGVLCFKALLEPRNGCLGLLAILRSLIVMDAREQVDSFTQERDLIRRNDEGSFALNIANEGLQGLSGRPWHGGGKPENTIRTLPGAHFTVSREQPGKIAIKDFGVADGPAVRNASRALLVGMVGRLAYPHGIGEICLGFIPGGDPGLLKALPLRFFRSFFGQGSASLRIGSVSVNFVVKEEECPATGPANSNHARTTLAERERADLAHPHVASKGWHDITSRRFGVTLEIPTSTRIIAEAIGPKRQYPA